MAGKQAGWIGLGLIGLPMAARLAAAGWQVRGFDLSKQRLEMALARGIAAADSAEGAMEGASVVFTSMPTETALIELAGRLAAGMPKSAILAETTTAGPAASAKVAETLAARRIAYLRAPISGSVSLAETGGLTTFVSGPRAAFDAARPALAAYSRAQIWLGEGEEARYAKLAVNLMVAVTAGMMAESMALAPGDMAQTWNGLRRDDAIRRGLEPLNRRSFIWILALNSIKIIQCKAEGRIEIVGLIEKTERGIR